MPVQDHVALQALTQELEDFEPAATYPERGAAAMAAAFLAAAYEVELHHGGGVSRVLGASNGRKLTFPLEHQGQPLGMLRLYAPEGGFGDAVAKNARDAAEVFCRGLQQRVGRGYRLQKAKARASVLKDFAAIHITFEAVQAFAQGAQLPLERAHTLLKSLVAQAQAEEQDPHSKRLSRKWRTQHPSGWDVQIGVTDQSSTVSVTDAAVHARGALPEGWTFQEPDADSDPEPAPEYAPEAHKLRSTTVALTHCMFRCTACKTWKPASAFGLRMDRGVTRNQPRCGRCR